MKLTVFISGCNLILEFCCVDFIVTLNISNLLVINLILKNHALTNECVLCTVVSSGSVCGGGSGDCFSHIVEDDYMNVVACTHEGDQHHQMPLTNIELNPRYYSVDHISQFLNSLLLNLLYKFSDCAPSTSCGPQ